MREMIGYLVACGGAERAVACIAASVPEQFQSRQFSRQQFRRKEDRADRALIGEESIGTDIAFDKAPSVAHPVMGDILADPVRSGGPITVFYAGENLADGELEESSAPSRALARSMQAPKRAPGNGARRN